MAASRFKVHPQQQVSEAGVVAPREPQYLSPVRMMTVEAGNMFGTSEHFTFFKAEVEAIRFPGAEK